MTSSPYNPDNLTTDTSKLRMALGDTDCNGVKPDDSHFSDAELQVFLDASQTWAQAVPMTMRALANMYASSPDSIAFGPWSESWGDMAAKLRSAADDWADMLDADGNILTGGLSMATMSMNMFISQGEWQADRASSNS